MNCRKDKNLCKIPFTYAFKFLLKGLTYTEALSKIFIVYTLFLNPFNFKINISLGEMLIRGGDTDTNCCIVGGLIGK
jgi:hypothetical protein